MGISVAVIMKNEEENVIPFINSCLQFADEIVINDTGSTDRSIQRALAYEKVVIYQTKWADDFSKARNDAIEECTQDWIVWLDLDDRIDEKSAQYIQLVSKNAQKNDIFLFNVRCAQHNTVQTLDFAQVRMFHRDSGVLFNRRIHENVEKSIIDNNLNKLYAKEIVVFHEGYSDIQLLKKKARRNISILNQEESSFSNYYDIGKAYAVLNKYLMTELFFNGAYELAQSNDQKNLIATSMLNFLIEQKNIPKIDYWLDKLVGESKIVLYYKAEAYVVKGKYIKARECFKQYLKMEKYCEQMFSYSDFMDKRANFIIQSMDEVDKKNVA